MKRITKQNVKEGLYRFILFLIILLPFLIYGSIQNSSKRERLEQCSKVTLIKIVRTYSSRGMARMEFYYTVNNKKYQFIESLGIERSENGGWSIDSDKIKKQKILVRYGCDNPNDYELLWNISIPDSLIFIPTNGWDSIPYGLGKYSKIERSFWDKLIHP